MEKTNITLETADKNKYWPNKNLIGGLYLHTGSRKLYRVIGYVWHGDTDEWLIQYVNYPEETEVSYTRTISNFKGKRDNSPIFIEVEQ